MPRTKLPRNTKRNRDAANEEALAARLREFDTFVESFLSRFELKYKQDVETLSADIYMLKRRIPIKMLNMKISDLLNMNTPTIADFEQMTKDSSKVNKTITLEQSRKKSRDDEGYLTEDSGSTVNTGVTTLLKKAPMMGPLSSAKARSRRRSRSACGYLNSAVKQTSTVEHSSRSRMRTPLLNRSKAFSADRAEPVTPKVAPNTPLSLLRYPKVGETVISLSGSPVVAQTAQDPIANVNIPVKNGMISLRPTKMAAIDPDIITRIDAETLDQIKQLQSNLNVFMSFVQKPV